LKTPVKTRVSDNSRPVDILNAGGLFLRPKDAQGLNRYPWLAGAAALPLRQHGTLQKFDGT
jgi:hypothetical protein